MFLWMIKMGPNLDGEILEVIIPRRKG
jgi:hypothetical protein